jgi:hypothetical protein
VKLRSKVLPMTIVPNVGSSFRISYLIGVAALSLDGFHVRFTSLPTTAACVFGGTPGACASRAQNRSYPP